MGSFYICLKVMIFTCKKIISTRDEEKLKGNREHVQTTSPQSLDPAPLTCELYRPWN